MFKESSSALQCAKLLTIKCSGKMSLLKMRAKSLITTRNQVQKFYTMGCQLQGLSLKLTSMASTAAMTDAMRVNSPIPPPSSSPSGEGFVLTRACRVPVKPCTR